MWCMWWARRIVYGAQSGRYWSVSQQFATWHQQSSTQSTEDPVSSCGYFRPWRASGATTSTRGATDSPTASTRFSRSHWQFTSLELHWKMVDYFMQSLSRFQPSAVTVSARPRERRAIATDTRSSIRSGTFVERLSRWQHWTWPDDQKYLWHEVHILGNVTGNVEGSLHWSDDSQTLYFTKEPTLPFGLGSTEFHGWSFLMHPQCTHWNMTVRTLPCSPIRMIILDPHNTTKPECAHQILTMRIEMHTLASRPGITPSAQPHKRESLWAMWILMGNKIKLKYWKQANSRRFLHWHDHTPEKMLCEMYP